MQNTAYKVRISMLWLLSVVGFFAYRTLALSEEVTEVSVLGNDEFAAYLVVAMGFAFLSLVLPTRLNRLTNLIAGSIFGVVQAIMLVDGATAYPDATFNLMTGATVVALASVVWLAIRWPGEAGTVGEKTTLVEADVPERELESIGRS